MQIIYDGATERKKKKKEKKTNENKPKQTKSNKNKPCKTQKQTRKKSNQNKNPQPIPQLMPQKWTLPKCLVLRNAVSQVEKSIVYYTVVFKH